ncbi:MAG: family 10 glycosylhydrolase [Ruminococcus sp.]|nr:family 10 glycosylhydrolase [Ruminococcus sp.]
MFYKRIIPYILSFVLLSGSIYYVADTQEVGTESSDSTPTQIAVEKPTQEIRGVWVTYMTLDVSGKSDKESAFKEKIDTVISDMKDANLNTMVVQVRPFSDAIYPSRYFPWSHILTGTQGEDPGYDPLKYIVQAAHENEIMVHAWVNPYRVSTKNTPDELSDDNPAVKNSGMTVEVNDGVYLNPADDNAIKLIADGVRELVRNYDIDAVQFDDYFYPPDCGNFDQEDYERYCESVDSPLSLEDFRKENVNQMVRAAYQAVHQTKQNVMFGISPQGNLGNNEGLYADVRKWCKEQGYIDYICPQIYFSLDNPALTFEDGLSDWLSTEKHDDLSLYIGIPAYKAGTDADGGTWLDNDEILKTEVGISREVKADGFILYSYDSFHNDDNAQEVQNVIRYLNE